MLLWREDWFVVTDRRLLMRTGLVTRRVAMMPLMKVTDMSYSRPPAGRVLGYGEIVIESAGQDQALRRIRHLPDPDVLYLEICELLFGPRAPVPGAGRGAGEVRAWAPVGCRQGRNASVPPMTMASRDRPRPGRARDRETGVALLAGVVLVRPRGLVELVVQLPAVLLHREPPGGQGRRPAITTTHAPGHARVNLLTHASSGSRS